MAKATGQAYDKSEQWLYTWFEDGSVWRSDIRRENGLILASQVQKVDPPVAWNADEFLMFVPVATEVSNTNGGQ